MMKIANTPLRNLKEFGSEILHSFYTGGCIRMKKNIVGFVSLILIFALVVVGGCAEKASAAEIPAAENFCVQAVAP